MTSRRYSVIVLRSLFVAAVVLAAALPYYAARWLIHHDAVYYRLGDTGHLGRFITDTAETINLLSPFPFLVLGLVVGIALAFTLRCFRAAAI